MVLPSGGFRNYSWMEAAYVEAMMREALAEARAAGESASSARNSRMRSWRRCSVAATPLSERHGHAVLFTTVEPCPLCLGAAVMADVPHIVFAHSRHIETYQGSVLRDESRALFER